jgi:hypothetical protein
MLNMMPFNSPIICCCAVLVLSACIQPAPRLSAESPSAKFAIATPSAKKLTPSVNSIIEPKPAPLSVDLYLSELEKIHGWSGEQSRRELAELNIDKRLDKIQRFRLAALLSRDDHGDWERGLKALEGLSEESDPRTHALVDLLRKLLRTRLDLRQQTARVGELQQRIQQIKALEKDLQQRSEPAKTP